MNKRIKVLVSAVLATVMLVLCIPFTAAAADETFVLVKDVADLAADDVIVIVGSKTAEGVTSYYALGTTQNKNNRASVSITVSDNTVVPDSSVQRITLKGGSVAGTFAFYTGTEGYLYAASDSSNHLKTKTDLDANGSWKVEINATTGAATIKAQGSNGRNWLRYNPQNNLFSAYASGQNDVYIYKLQAGGSGNTCEHTYTDCTDTTCDKNCGHTRTAPGHSYANCESTACSNCTAGNRTAPGHAYTNEYDAKCNNCTAGDRPVTLPAADSKLTNDVANKLGLAQDKKAYTTNKYFVTGEVTEIKDTEYGNLYIKDANGDKFYVYGVYSWEGTTRYDALTDKPAVGDTITVYGIIGTYNGTEAQMKNGWLYVEVANCEHEYTNDFDATCNKCSNGNRTVTLPAADSTLDYATITKLGLAQGHNAYTSAKYYFVGTIKEITKAQYGNLVLTDEDGNEFVVYGSYNSTGDTGFSSMTDPFEVGDKVKVYGIVGQFNGTAQIKDGWLSAYTAGSGSQGAGSPDTGDSVVAYIAVAVVALFGIAYVSKKH